MTASSGPLGDEWGRRAYVALNRGQLLGRRQASRMSRHFAGVGVGIPAARLREIAAGAPVDSDEWVDVIFGLTASETKREERLAKIARTRRRGTHWLIVALMVLVALSGLLCMACGFFTLVEHAAPF